MQEHNINNTSNQEPFELDFDALDAISAKHKGFEHVNNSSFNEFNETVIVEVNKSRFLSVAKNVYHKVLFMVFSYINEADYYKSKLRGSYGIHTCNNFSRLWEHSRLDSHCRNIKDSASNDNAPDNSSVYFITKNGEITTNTPPEGTLYFEFEEDNLDWGDIINDRGTDLGLLNNTQVDKRHYKR